MEYTVREYASCYGAKVAIANTTVTILAERNVVQVLFGDYGKVVKFLDIEEFGIKRQGYLMSNSEGLTIC
jgi:hypothetical protein